MARTCTPTPEAQRGFALVETLVAATLLIVGMAGILSLVDASASTTRTTMTREAATTLQRELVEGARSVPYEQLTPNAIAAGVKARPGLADSRPGTPGWQVDRRGTTYTVSVGVCVVDDPRDGLGAHEAGLFCRAPTGASSADCAEFLDVAAGAIAPPVAGVGTLTAGDCGIDADLDGAVDGLAQASASLCLFGSCGATPDLAPADYKRLVVLLRWPGGWNLQTATVNAPGSAAAPAVLSVTAPATLTTGSSVSLSATVSPSPATVSFAREGRQVATGSLVTPGVWGGQWNLGAVTTADGAQPAAGETLDGVHLLAATAYDAYGQFGVSRSATVAVNRRRPFAPVRIGAGRNGAVVEIEWSPAKEHDVVGYRAYRTVGLGPRSLICPLTEGVGCEDPSPPTALSVTYDVVAVDKDPSGALREGDRSAGVAVGLTNRPPPPPTGLSGVRLSTGTRLTWSAGGPDPDLGDAVDHYNVYRDGTGRGSRVDLTDVADRTWLDTRGEGGTHQYWITAVDSHLAESTPVGPVAP